MHACPAVTEKELPWSIRERYILPMVTVCTCLENQCVQTDGWLRPD